MRKLIAILFFLTIMAVAEKIAPEKSDFSLKDPKGKTHFLSDYRGKAVIIDFWAIWCVSCRRAFPVLNGLQEKFGKERLAVLGVSYDKKQGAEVAKFAKKAGIGYTVLLDPDATTAKQFDVESLPTMIVLSPEGVVLYVQQGIDEGEKDRLAKQVEAALLPLPSP